MGRVSHYDTPLTDFVHRENLLLGPSLADMVFPSVGVSKSSGKFAKFDSEAWNRNEAKARAPGTESAGGTFSSSLGSYATESFAFHDQIDWDEVDNEDAFSNIEQDSALLVNNKIRLLRDVSWATRFFGTGIWTTDINIGAGTAWSAATGTPIKDIRAQILAQHLLTGFRPNTLVLDAATENAVLDSQDFIDRMGGSTRDQPAAVNHATIASLLGLDNVYVSYNIINTAKAGAVPAKTHAWVASGASGGALLTYSNKAGNKRLPSAGYTFAWTGRRGTDSDGQSMARFDMRKLKATRIEGEIALSHQLVAADMGTFFHGTV